MGKITKVIGGILLSLLVFTVFASATNAQITTTYHFLEIVDSHQKPIQGANVEIRNRRDGAIRILQTNEKGAFGINLIYPTGYRFGNSLFTIRKEGYFPFYDFGLILWQTHLSHKIELWKIPKTKRERKVLGIEQLKREFIPAVHQGDTNAVRRLLKLGVNPNTSNLDLKGISFYRRGTSYKVNKDVERIPAIAYAIRLGHGAIVKLLLENGAAFNKAPKKNRNSRWHLDTSNALGFYLHPVDSRKLFARDSKGDFILTNEERKKLRQKLWKEWLDGLAVLIKKGINVNTRIRDRGTALKIVKGWAKHYKKQGEDVYDFAKIIKLLKAAGAK